MLKGSSRKESPNDGRGDGQHIRGGGHKQMDVDIRDCQADRSPEEAEKGRSPQGIPQCLTNTLALICAKVGGKKGLGRLSYTIGAALNDSADADDNGVDRQGIAI